MSFDVFVGLAHGSIYIHYSSWKDQIMIMKSYCHYQKRKSHRTGAQIGAIVRMYVDEYVFLQELKKKTSLYLYYSYC